MTVNLDTEIVATTTGIGTAGETCAYTIGRDGKRWTVRVPLAQLEAHGANEDARRAHLANVLTAVMQGAPDNSPV